MSHINLLQPEVVQHNLRLLAKHVPDLEAALAQLENKIATLRSQ